MKLHRIAPLLPFFLLLGLQQGQAQNPDLWSLRRCIEHARANNLALRQAELNVASSEIGLAESRARRMPSASGNSSLASRFGYFVDPFTNTLKQQNVQTLNLGLSSGLDLYNGGSIAYGIRQSETDLAAARAGLEQQEYDLALNVALGYLNILQAGENVEAAQVQLASTREQRERSAKLVQAGALAQADLLQIEAQIASDELSLVSAQNQLESAHLSLMQLLNLPQDQPFGVERVQLPEIQNEIFALSLEEVYAVAEKNLPSIRQADLQKESALIGERIAQSARYPSLSLGASVGSGYSTGRDRVTGFEPSDPQVIDAEINDVPVTLELPQFRTLTETYTLGNQLSDNINAFVALQLNVPIYSRGSIRYGVERAQIARANAELGAEQARQGLYQALQQAYVNARNAYSSYQANARRVEAAQLSFGNIEKQYNVGLVNATEYLVAQNDLNRARFDQLRAKYEYWFRLKILDFYQGKPLGFE
jgi:outer membrane protein